MYHRTTKLISSVRHTWIDKIDEFRVKPKFDNSPQKVMKYENEEKYVAQTQTKTKTTEQL